MARKDVRTKKIWGFIFGGNTRHVEFLETLEGKQKQRQFDSILSVLPGRIFIIEISERKNLPSFRLQDR